MLLASGFVLGTAMLCVALPLFVYGTTLAAFGLPHVIAEMRYVYHRFATRWSHAAMLFTGVILLSIVLIRIMLWLKLMSPTLSKPLELGLVASLISLLLFKTSMD